VKSRDRVRAGLLFDLYGPLLTDHQQEIWQLYYLEDWSLAEIGESRGISRSAVYDILDRTEKLLEDYEGRLGLLGTHERRQQSLRLIRGQLAALSETYPELRAVQTALDRLAEEEGLIDV